MSKKYVRYHINGKPTLEWISLDKYPLRKDRMDKLERDSVIFWGSGYIICVEDYLKLLGDDKDDFTGNQIRKFLLKEFLYG